MKIFDANQRDNNLNFIRLVAAYSVLAGHSWPLSGTAFHDPISKFLAKYLPFHMGIPGIAVAIFFVISGYLITKSASERDNLVVYSVSRITRIYPPLIVCLLLITFVMGPLMTTLPLQEYLGHKGTWKYLQTNIPMLDIRYQLPGVFQDNPQKGVNGSLWTLPAEIWCYIVVGFLAVFGVFKDRLINNVVLVFIFFAFTLSDPIPVFKENHLRLILFFFIGSAFYANREFLSFKFLPFAFGILASVIVFDTPVFNVVGSLTLSYAILWIGYTEKIRMPRLKWLGDISYGVYIFAFPIQQLVITYFKGDDGIANPYLVWFVATPPTVLLAWISWNIIEKPSMKLKNWSVLKRLGEQRVAQKETASES